MHKFFFKFTLLAFLAFFTGKVNSQTMTGYSLQLADSLKMEVKDFSGNFNFPIVKAAGDHIYYTGGDSLQILKFDFNGKRVDIFPKEKTLINIPHQLNALIPLPDGSVFFGFGRTSLIHFKDSKQVPDTLKFNGIFQNKFYYQDVSQNVTDYAYSPVSKTLFVPIFHFAKDLAHVKNPKYYRQSDKLLAVCTIAGKEITIKNLITDRDSVYYEALFPHLIQAGFQLTESADHSPKLYVNEMASPKIRVYSLDGQKRHTFGEPAKHPGINASAIPNPYLLNRDKGGYLSFKYFIESPAYTFVYHAPANGLTFRGYRASVKDPSVYKKYKVEIKACNVVPETPTDKTQHAALKTKPYGLQIYNEQHRLVYDEIMPRPTRSILKTEGNMIWTDGRADKAHNAYWIYKFQIIAPEIIGSAK
jgi:hypothetical protein